MPCNSDYLEPTERERQLQLVAILYRYALKKMNLKVPINVATAATDIYCTFDFVPDLCNLIGKMDATERRNIVYNPYNIMAQQLADWWEEHQRADKEREKEEQAEHNRKRVAAAALKKLTRAERKALEL